MEPIEWLGFAAVAGAAYLLGKTRRKPKRLSEPVAKTTKPVPQR